jgi:serine/threonine-protein kinase
MRIVPIICMVILLIAAFVFIQAIAGELPERVATHFAADGHPNGYMSREECRSFMLEFTLGGPIFIAVVTALFPLFIPASLFNLPNREYWLAPERAADSRGFLSEQGIWFGCILLVFLIAVDWMVAAANAGCVEAVSYADVYNGSGGGVDGAGILVRAVCEEVWEAAEVIAHRAVFSRKEKRDFIARKARDGAEISTAHAGRLARVNREEKAGLLGSLRSSGGKRNDSFAACEEQSSAC